MNAQTAYLPTRANCHGHAHPFTTVIVVQDWKQSNFPPAYPRMLGSHAKYGVVPPELNSGACRNITKCTIRFHARLCRYPQTPYYCKHCPICYPQGAIVLTQALVGRDTNTLNKLSTRAFDPTLTIITVAVALTVVTARPGTRDTQTLLRLME
jgi:hypothetical protein